MVVRSVKLFSFIVAFVLCVIYGTTDAYANSLVSPNYSFNESAVGTGGVLESNSTNYQASNTTGDLVVGNSASANYQIDSGSKTTNDPALSFVLSSGAINFGDFSASTATVTSTTFSVTNYTSFGYVVQIIGSAPTSGSTTINAMDPAGPSYPGASIAGTSQFGINLVANTSPTSVGANPNNGQFGFGAAAGNYGTSNSYRYVSGETIALAPKSSGTTIYTMTYMVNVPALTPGGKYTCDQTLIVTGTY